MLIIPRHKLLLLDRPTIVYPHRVRRDTRASGPFPSIFSNTYVVNSGSAVYNNSGAMTVPTYNRISFTLDGAGGGGGAGVSNGGATGGTSTVQTATPIVANGGTGGGPSPDLYTNGPNGSPGGGTGPTGAVINTGAGAGGGSGGYFNNPHGYTVFGGTGGAGGQVIMTWNYNSPGAPVPGTALSFTLGAGGIGGNAGGGLIGNSGTNATLQVSWA